MSGSVNATMSRDHAYAFLMLGRHVERADMTTRVLDVQAGIMMDNPTEALSPYADLTWMSMLRSLGGEQMFRRSARRHGVRTQPPCSSCCATPPSPARSSTA